MSDGPTFVLVPGAGGSPWFWHLAVAELAARGHDAIAVDLPGADESADLPDYVDAVVTAAAGCPEIVMVGQSLGGITAVLACDRLPVSQLVLVNAMIPIPGETAGDWWANSGQRVAKVELDHASGRDPDGEFDVMTYFLHDLSPELASESGLHARDQAGRPFGTPASFDSWPDVTTHVVVGRDDRLFPASFQHQQARERAGVEADELPGGHLLPLSNPGGFVDLLVSYLPE